MGMGRKLCLGEGGMLDREEGMRRVSARAGLPADEHIILRLPLQSLKLRLKVMLDR